MFFIELDIGTVFLIVAIVINILLTIITILRFNSTKDKTIPFFLFLISMMVWSIPLLIYGFVSNKELALLLSKISYVGAGFSSIALLNFSFYFSLSQKNITKKKLLLNLFNILYINLLFLTYFTDLIVVEFKNFSIPTESILEFGILYPVYVVFLLMAFLMAILIFYISSRGEVVSLRKTQLKYMYTGIIITLALQFSTNLILPTLGIFNLYWAGPIFIIILATFLTMAVTKHNLFNIKIITTELFVGIFWITIFTRTLLSRTAEDQIFNLIMFLLSVILGYFLTKSVYKEVRTRELLAVANEQLKRLNLEKSEFLSIATHQLKSPLTVIRGYTSMLMEGSYGKLPDKAQETLNRVYDSVANLVIIIDDFLNISRIDQGRMKYDFGIVDVRKLVGDISEELRHMAKSKNITLTSEVKGNGQYHITADYGKIRQILSNIIDNAVKYTKEGTVNIVAEEDIKNKKIKISISDNGMGMTKETINKLFKRFSRAKDVGKVEIGGSGLGLFIAKQMVEAHGGRIWAESDGDGKGSVFIVELPFLPPNTTPLRKRQENSADDSTGGNGNHISA